MTDDVTQETLGATPEIRATLEAAGYGPDEHRHGYTPGPSDAGTPRDPAVANAIAAIESLVERRDRRIRLGLASPKRRVNEKDATSGGAAGGGS